MAHPATRTMTDQANFTGLSEKILSFCTDVGHDYPIKECWRPVALRGCNCARALDRASENGSGSMKYVRNPIPGVCSGRWRCAQTTLVMPRAPASVFRITPESPITVSIPQITSDTPLSKRRRK